MILITGGTGYIGSHLIKKLSGSGEKVITLDRHPAKKSLLHDTKLVIGDITNPQDLATIFSTYDIDLVIHLAALVNAAESVDKKNEYYQVNEAGSRLVWEEAIKAGVKHFIYASSAAVYGIPAKKIPIKESSPLMPTNPYGVGKLAGEKSLEEIANKKANYVIFRFFNVAGAHKSGVLKLNKKSQAIIGQILAVAAGESPKLILNGDDYDTPDGTVVRDFIHVEDIVSAIMAAIVYLRRGKPSVIANLGTGKATSMLQLHSLAEKITGRSIPLEFATRKSGDISYSLSNSAIAQKTLNWSPKNNIEDILHDAWNAYVHH